MECTLYLTDNCNLKCSYCYEGNRKNKNSMNENTLSETLNYLVNKAKENERIKISFLGGEPLLNKKILLRTFKLVENKYKNYEKQFEYSITTNGTLIDDEIMSIFKQNNFDISISIDGDRYTHNLNRRSINDQDVYDVVIRNMNILINNNIDFSIRMTVAVNNVAFLYSNIEYFYELGAKKILVGFNDFDDWNENAINILNFQMEKISKFYINKIIEDELFIIDIFDYKFSSFLINRRIRFCSAGNERHFAVNSIGEIYPCSYVTNDIEWKIGSVNHGIERKKFVDMARTKVSSKSKCTECKIRFTCLAARCGFLNYNNSGYLNIPGNSTCKLEKLQYEYVYKIIEELYRSKNSRITNLIDYILNNNLEFTESMKEIMDKVDNKIN